MQTKLVLAVILALLAVTTSAQASPLQDRISACQAQGDDACVFDILRTLAAALEQQDPRQRILASGAYVPVDDRACEANISVEYAGFSLANIYVTFIGAHPGGVRCAAGYFLQSCLGRSCSDSNGHSVIVHSATSFTYSDRTGAILYQLVQ